MTFLIQNNRAQGTEGARARSSATMLERLKAVPGVVDATSAGPDSARRRQFAGALRPARSGHRSGEVPAGDRPLRAAGYFAFAKTPIIAGRAFTDADNRPEAKRHHHRRADGGAAVPERQRRRPAHARARHHHRARHVRGHRRRQAPAPHDDDERRRGGRCSSPTATRSSARRSDGRCRTSGDPDAIAGAVRSALAAAGSRACC